MGSARLKSSWLKDRYSWVNSDLEPLEPDYSLMSGSKLVADLVEYDYWNPAQADEAAAVEASPLPREDAPLLNVGELPVELQLPCIESGLLRLPLELQRAAWRKELAGGPRSPPRSALAWRPRRWSLLLAALSAIRCEL